MTVQAFAKINPFLKITGTRPDGYHDLDIVFLPVTLCDTLTAEVNDSGDLHLFCSDPSVPIEENLITKAYRMVKADHPELCGMDIELIKNIPSGAGLGGGSADAAACLRLLNSLGSLDLGREELMAYAAGLGADVPALLLGTPSHGAGIGEILTPVESQLDAELLIVSPGFFCSTKEMYQRFDGRSDLLQPDSADEVCRVLEKGDLQGLCRHLFNVFEQLLDSEKRERISLIKRELNENGAAGALMTGSGSCVFGLFETAEERDAAAERMEKKYQIYPAAVKCY